MKVELNKPHFFLEQRTNQERRTDLNKKRIMTGQRARRFGARSSSLVANA